MRRRPSYRGPASSAVIWPPSACLPTPTAHPLLEMAQSTERYSKNTSPAIGPASGGIAATGRRLLARRPEEFKLDVIRVAENEDGIRNRIRHVSHASVRHSLAVQPARPGVQIRSARDGEREMVKTRSSLIGHFLLVRCMVM